jgi:hypothetical protein
MPQTLHVYSWPRTLTEWCVIQAFRRARCPGCLRRPAILSAAFVSEVSEVIRFQTFSLPTAIVAGLLQEAAEAAYEKAGGSAYRATRDAAEAAEDDFIRTVIGLGHCQRRLAVREQCDAALDAHRRRYSAEARAAQRRCARAYWAEQSGHRLAIDLLAHRADSHPLRRIAQFAPAWWERFVRCLRHEISRCNITAFHVLDELPQLRAQARRERKKVLAVIGEWRESRADELGLPAQLHYHVLANRGADKARVAARWFNGRARGYTSNWNVSEAARHALAQHVETLPMPAADFYSAA